MSFLVICPSCKNSVQAEDELIGTDQPCLYCNESVLIIPYSAIVDIADSQARMNAREQMS